MESSKSPTETYSIENKELQLKATELAKASRERGMGILYGTFTYRNGESQGFEMKGYFIQGEEVPDGSYMFTISKDGVLIRSNSPGYGANIFSQEVAGGNHEAWTIAPYRVPMEVKMQYKPIKVEKKRTVIEKKFFGLKTTTMIKPYIVEKQEEIKTLTNNPLTRNGKRGNHDWIQYDYLMKGTAGGRSGALDMSITVPPDIARQIDEQVNRHVIFQMFFSKHYIPITLDQMPM